MYNYMGLTTYIQGTIEENKSNLVVLSHAVEPLSTSIDMIYDDLPIDVQNAVQVIVQSKEFETVEENSQYAYVESFEMPNNYPEGYDDASISEVEINGHKLTRIYIPFVAKRINLAYIVQHSLKSVILSLFGHRVVSMKSFESNEYEDFKDGKKTVLVSNNAK